MRAGNLIAVIGLGALASCGGSDCRSWQAELAVCERVLPAKVVAILHDPTAVGASGSRMDAAVARYLTDLVGRPGSILTIWLLDSTLGRIREIAREVVPEGHLSRAGRVRRAERMAAALRARYRDSLDLELRRSPLVEGIGKALRAARIDAAALAARGGSVVIELVALTDGLEEGTRFGSFECRAPLPSEAAFVDKVLSDGLLTRASGVPIRVSFGFLDLASIDRERCPLIGGRAMAVESRWRALFEGLGYQFTVASGVPDPAVARDGEVVGFADGEAR